LISIGNIHYSAKHDSSMLVVLMS